MHINRARIAFDDELHRVLKHREIRSRPCTVVSCRNACTPQMVGQIEKRWLDGPDYAAIEKLVGQLLEKK